MAIKGREVRQKLTGKVHEELVMVIAAMAEDHGVIQQEILQLSKLLDELLDNYLELAQAFATIVTAPELKRHLAKLMKDREKHSVDNIRKGDAINEQDIH